MITFGIVKMAHSYYPDVHPRTVCQTIIAIGVITTNIDPLCWLTSFLTLHNLVMPKYFMCPGVEWHRVGTTTLMYKQNTGKCLSLNACW